MIIRKKEYLSNPVKSGQKSRVLAEIFVDTADKFPKTDDFDDFELVQGSIAYVITTGKFYVLSGGGEWYCSDET